MPSKCLRIVVAFLLFFPAVAFSTPKEREIPAAQKASIQKSFGKLPLYFIKNQGQVHKDVAYYVKGSDKTLYFKSEGITFALTGKEGEETKRWTVKLEFIGANENVEPRGEQKQEAIFSYFKGKPEDWKTGCFTYNKLIYENLWPGIDLVYSGTVNQLKYELVVRPGADPEQILLAYKGAKEVKIKETGELMVSTPVGGFEDARPFAYQQVGEKKVEVSLAYVLEKENTDTEVKYRFQTGAYDQRKTLILDPAMLLYCGYIGGEFSDYGGGIAVDSAGNAYVTGSTGSDESSFPIIEGPDLTYNGNYDVLVAKINTPGTSLVYCGYIGGMGADSASGIAVDSFGNVYVAGQTNSSESEGFPITAGPDLTFNGYRDVFVAKVSASGMGLDYCGYIGGEDREEVSGIAVDDSGRAYVIGTTVSSENEGFPVIAGPDLTFNGIGGINYEDAFVAKVSASGIGLDYCGYIGGTSFDYGYGIVVDIEGNAYVTGATESSESMDFPIVVGPDLSFNGIIDAFVAKLNPSGIGFIYCGYVGGTQREAGKDIAVDNAGNAYVTGVTSSSESDGFPVTYGPDLTFNGYNDAFIAKIAALGTEIDYCGYIGGGDYDIGLSIAIENLGNAYVTGYARSSESDGFPATCGPDLTFNGGDSDGFIAKVSPLGIEMIYCGYIGGTSGDNGFGIAVDGVGNAYVTGYTGSNESSFPVTGGPDLTFNGEGDAFVAKIKRYQLWYVDGIAPGPAHDGLSWPTAFLAIQEGINAAEDGDVVLVAPETYVENINFLGKAIHVRSDGDKASGTYDIAPESTIINGNQLGSTVVFEIGEGLDSVIEGFSITNGSATGGGGIRCQGASPTVTNNLIFNNFALGGGGGIHIGENSFAKIANNKIFKNRSDHSGGGVNISGAFPLLVNNVISRNIADYNTPQKLDSHLRWIS